MQHILSPVFAIGSIHIGQVEGASCVNFGNNWPTNFRSYKKHNQGFGSVSGNNTVVRGARSLLNDPDTYDMMSVPDGEVPDWISELLGPAQTESNSTANKEENEFEPSEEEGVEGTNKEGAV